ncbi:hypothetical protein PQQ96_36235 [Paraburkholderia sediminicola]|uniref:hypothetical protein n=1 Tax=Paraburkholderia sediminicola TaxID=458836 RepID=UPI0038B9640E
MLIQKFHPGIRLGQHPILTGSGNPLFSRQGHWDGGSTLHCAAMALAMLGKLSDPLWLPYHRSGHERVFWDHAWPHYLHGLTLSELASFIAELNLSVRTATCTARGTELLRFAGRQIDAGRPVVVGWRQRHPVKWHAALVTGIEGTREQRAFTPHALLLLDPAGNAPVLAGYNARIDVRGRGRPRYLSPDATRDITFAGALSVRNVTAPP